MRSILFAGSDDVSLPALSLLAERGWVRGVLSAPPGKAGRGRAVRHTPVAEYARRRGLPLFCFSRLDERAREQVARLGCAMLVSVSYGYYFPPAFLALFRDGAINLHPSLLPRFRGSSPLFATLLSGDSYGGVSIIAIAAEMDGGDILAQRRVAITPLTTKKGLRRWCAETGAELIVGLLEGESGQSREGGLPSEFPREGGLPNGQSREGGLSSEGEGGLSSEGKLPRGRPQEPSQVVCCMKITKAHGRINWRQPAEAIGRHLVAFRGWPGSFTILRNKRLIIHSGWVYNTTAEAKADDCGRVLGFDPEGGICVQTGRGIVALDRVQLEYKKILDWQGFVNGYRLMAGEMLGAEAEKSSAEAQTKSPRAPAASAQTQTQASSAGTGERQT